MIDFASPLSDTETAPSKEKQVLTFSSLNTFRSCQRRYKNRYEDGLVPLKSDADALYLGTVVHRALEMWYGIGDKDLARRIALETIDDQCKERNENIEVKRTWQIARAMVAGYIDRYPTEDWEVEAVEHVFNGTIINPKSRRESRTFTIKGKVDLIVKLNGELYAVDHKTRKSLSENWIEQIEMDTQMAVYVYFLRQAGLPIKGAVHNVLLKSGLKQNLETETEEEFAARYAESCAKNKNGKSNIKRKVPESDEDFAARLADWYADADKFQRAVVELPPERMDLIQEEIWEITQMYLDVRSRDIWLRNTGVCYQWGQACEYLPYCRSNFCTKVKEELFGWSATVHNEFSEWGGE